jgi:hypothetical protein
MRLSELLGREVVDGAGRPRGRVVEVVLVQDGPPVGPGGDLALRVEGLVVGRRALFARLGLQRADVVGPRLLAAVARRVAGTHDYVRWEQVRDCPDEAGAPVVAEGEFGELPALDG